MFTFASESHYIPVAKRDEKLVRDLQKILLQIACEDEDLLKSLQSIMGYSLTGETSAQKFFIWLGSHGSNGKGLLGRAMIQVMGRFLKTVKKAIMIDSGHQESMEAPNPELLKLKTGRLALTTEIQVTDTINVDMILRLTGEDEVTARALYQKSEPDRFVTQNKLHGQMNDLPRFPTSSEAFKRRPVIIPFQSIFVDDDQVAEKQAVIDRREKEDDQSEIISVEYEKVYRKDRTVEDRLKQGGDLIDIFFSWLVDGAMNYYTDGLYLCEKIKVFTKASVSDQDVVQRFIDEHIDLTHKKADRMEPKTIHNNFVSFLGSINNTEKTNYSKKRFDNDLRKKNWQLRKSNGARFWSGVTFKKNSKFYRFK